MGVVKMAFLDEKIGERNNIGGAHARMKGNQALPDGERCGELISTGQFPNDVEIRGAIRRNDVVENGFNVGIDTPAARKSLGGPLGVGVDGAANFRKSLRDLALAQQKIPVAPGDGGGCGIRIACLDIGAAGSEEVVLRFVDSGEVEPGGGVAWI